MRIHVPAVFSLKNMKQTIFSLALCAALGVGASAAELPQLVRHIPAAGLKATRSADNGLWVTAQRTGDDGSYGYAQVLNVATGEFVKLYGSDAEGASVTAQDVTDSGNIIAGSLNGVPALYNREKSTWTKLPVPSDFRSQYGSVNAITADGCYAVGAISAQVGENYRDVPVVWSLNGTEATVITLSNVPDFDSSGAKAMQVTPLDITPDGKKIFFRINYSYPDTEWCFIYDVDTQSWKAIGYNYVGGKLVRNTDAIHMIDGGSFSPNGAYLGLEAFDGETGVVGLYTMASGKLEVLPESTSMIYNFVDDNGVVYASSPSSTPVRDWGFFADGYWYDYRLALRELYGIDWSKDFLKDDSEKTGTFVGASADGSRLVATNYASQSSCDIFTATLTAPLKELSKQLDPLANNYAVPAAGSVFSTVRNVLVNFDRDIEVVGGARDARLVAADGSSEVMSMAFALQTGSTRTAAITFRNAAMADGKAYELVIPAGTIRIKGDTSRLNKEIRVRYYGRTAAPVRALSIAPAAGTKMPRLSMASNPVIVNFDAQIAPTGAGGVTLERLNGDTWENVTGLTCDLAGSVMTIYPASDIDLAKDVHYRVSVAANTVGDIVGANGNEAFSVEYIGTYEPEPTWDNGIIFSENFDAGIGNMLLYDGDQKRPVGEMAAWRFTSEYPWWYVRDSETSADQSAASHSMYSPSGTSDDWMITTRMYIPDAECMLSFDSQSYLKGKEDRLKVYVLATDAVYTAPIGKSVVDTFKNNAVLVYDELQSPGASEATLAGDWRANRISLADYAGRNIYIAFVNDNTNQSAVFVDNILVERNLQFTVSLGVPSLVVAQNEVPVKGVVAAMSDDTVVPVSFRLFDSEGTLVDRLDVEGVSLSKNQTYEFAFAKALPLTAATENSFTVEIETTERTVPFAGSVKNLSFAPRRTVVLEEVTGTACQFCPLGHRAIELMNEIYGDRLIPLAIHGYTGGSRFLNTWTENYGAFLGLNAAPTAALNRQAVGSPFGVNDAGEYVKNSADGDTWFDIASRQLAEMTDAEIEISEAIIDTNSKRVQIAASMRYAYNAPSVNLNLHTVVLENGLKAVQTNGVYKNTSEILGPWKEGGAYGSASAQYVFDHVARGQHGNSYAGVSGFFPTSVESEKSYDVFYSFDTPSAVSKPENTDVVLMLIDANSGRIINAAKSTLTLGVAGIENVVVESNDDDTIYNLMGQPVINPRPGIYIRGGRKIYIR